MQLCKNCDAVFNGDRGDTGRSLVPRTRCAALMSREAPLFFEKNLTVRPLMKLVYAFCSMSAKSSTTTSQCIDLICHTFDDSAVGDIVVFRRCGGHANGEYDASCGPAPEQQPVL